MLFALFLLSALFFCVIFLFRLTGRLGRHIAAAAKKLVQKRKGSGLAVDFIVIRIIAVVPLTEHAAHFITEQVQVIFTDAHLLHCLVNLRNTQAAGTLQAVAFIHGNAVFHFGNENNSDIFLTLAAHFRLHENHSFSVQYTILRPENEKQIINICTIRSSRCRIQTLQSHHHTIDGSYTAPREVL